MLKVTISKDICDFFEFVKVFPKDKIYFVDGIHIYADDVKLKAKMFADYLVESELLPRKSN